MKKNIILPISYPLPHSLEYTPKVFYHEYWEDGDHNDVDGVVLGVIVPAVGLVGQLHGEDPDQGDH